MFGRLVAGILAHVSVDVPAPAPSYTLIVNDNDKVLTQAHIDNGARKRHDFLWKDAFAPDAMTPHKELSLVCDAC